ncbi:hypothetical protein DWY49_01505 [Roseburia sp. AF25-25LB]|nr:hypothetical protein DWY49_01505 [Roseburia sp. AF25-25LB]RHV60320.1 hypothetical protein DXB42_02885 [Roseburia sp. OM04-10AA]
MQIGKFSYHAVENETGSNSIENEKIHLTGEHRKLPVTDNANDNQASRQAQGRNHRLLINAFRKEDKSFSFKGIKV